VKIREVSGVFLIAVCAWLIHGYHPYVEDAEIYLPGIEKILHPELFPHNAEFFQSHAHLTLFPNLIALSVRWSHSPFDVALLVWHLGSIFLLLMGCYVLIARCFSAPYARWAGVALVAALLTLPVAGTSLYILDQYLNPRNLAAFAGIFAIARVIEKRYWRAGIWLVFAAAVHPLMSAFAFSLAFLVVTLDLFPWDQVILEKFSGRATAFAIALPFGISLDPPSPAYQEAMRYHSFHFLTHWAWYEWLGIVAPVAILWWFGKLARTKALPNLNLLCRALIIYDLVYFAVALAIQLPARFEYLARFQPLRSLHLLYILLFLFAGGLLGENWLKNRVSRWLVLFGPLCGGMFYAQRQLFPASSHLELPGISPRNEWAQAFLWVRQQTPVDALFALDPEHMNLAGEDEHGFRAQAQRSMLADAVKDSGAVSMFPPLAEEWLRQVKAQQDWKRLQLQDFRQFHEEYGVNWIVEQQPGIPGLSCPYGNQAVLVCQLD
jgi:hypothetical protein